MCDPRILIRIKNMHLHQWHGPIDRLGFHILQGQYRKLGARVIHFSSHL